MKHQEHKLQCLCVKWFKVQYPNDIIFAVPNGGARHMLEAKRLQNEGVLSGVSDLVVLKNKQAIFIEMKTQQGKQTDNQKAFQHRVTAQGFAYHLCRSFSEFKNIINQITL